MIQLDSIAQEIRDILRNKRNEMSLEFFEDEHRYMMKDLEGNIRSDFPSVSKICQTCGI